MLATRARDNGVILTYTNTVGGQDELVFDGNSVVMDHTGEVVARAKGFDEDLLVVDLNVEAVARARAAEGRKPGLRRKAAAPIDRVELKGRPTTRRTRLVPSIEMLADPLDEVYHALTLGVRDYVSKNGFKQAVVGLSGGIDSALTAVIAVDALGVDNVLGVFMPSPYTSRESREDTEDLVRRLGIGLKTLPITPPFQSYLETLKPAFAGTREDATEENLQARIRGNLLMALSNKFGHLVLTTGNKSEMSVGYATLYGDMAGGFAVIKDVPKTMVYELAKRRNGRRSTIIPKRILDRAPTAELRPNQKDEDSLPPYPVLDPILKAYVEDDRSVEEMVEMGFDRKTVLRVVGLVDRSEYKRRQAPVGIKITHRGLGKDRRMPITNKYRGL
jgi:NAD+ synthase (glutamine-hydrolysing)